MLPIFEQLRQFIKPQSCVVDNFIYQLHYKATFLLLMLFCLLVTARQYIGDPIECMSEHAVPHKMLDAFCWVHTTFSMESAWHKKVGSEVPYPGVGSTQGADDGRIYHKYYQWVCFALGLQAFLFYVPRMIWKAVEGGLVKKLRMSLKAPILSDEQRSANLELLTDYFVKNMNQHNSLYLIYTSTELLNFINVIGQMWLMNLLLGGEFWNYGWEVLKFTEWHDSVRFDPMIRIFPRLTKCIFYYFGNGGDVAKTDALCILPINVLNEKIYIILWFWFYILAVLTFAALVYRLLTIFVPAGRAWVTHFHCRFVTTHELRTVLTYGSMGDWFLLNLLAKNFDPINYKDFIFQLGEKLARKRDSMSTEHHDQYLRKMSLLSRSFSMEKQTMH